MGELGNVIYNYISIVILHVKINWFVTFDFFFHFILDEEDGTTSPLNLPQTTSEHDDDESDSDCSDKGKKILNFCYLDNILSYHSIINETNNVSPHIRAYEKFSNYFCVCKILSQ